MATSYKRWQIDWNRRFDRELRRIDSRIAGRVNWSEVAYYRIRRFEPEDAATHYAETQKLGG